MIGLPPLLSGGELLAAISHACVSYNVVNWSLSQVSLQLSHGASPSISALSSASLIAGMMCGQLVFGGLGDVWGRKRALALSLSFCTLGALLSSVSSGATVYEQIMVWRFAIGIGAGGVYPLASSLARESAPAHRESTAVALVFSMQGVGYLCSPLTMLLLLAVAPSSSWPVLWRVHLALGAVPLVLLLLVVTASGGFASASKQTSSEELSPPRNASLGRSTGTESEDVQLFTAIRDKAYFLPFLGTALPWLGFDICFYGELTPAN
jgi:PHS family inorganic phosphate transporter-like MFS transporter